jgi:hypothetical protein
MKCHFVFEKCITEALRSKFVLTFINVRSKTVHLTDETNPYLISN